MTRRIVYLSGSRADFGLMGRSLRAIDADPRLDLEILISGQHLSGLHGLTATDIEGSGFASRRLAEVPMVGADRAEMSTSVAQQMQSITAALAEIRPDLLLLLGDRGEMVAGALAAVFLGIPIAHFHGGERSGTVDDQFRRAISALAHIHFPPTEAARDRLLRMGEVPENIHWLGAPGLDAIRGFTPIDAKDLRTDLGLRPSGPLFMVVFHPVVQDADLAALQTSELLSALSDQNADVVIMAPNSDAGSAAISATYRNARSASEADRPARFHWFTHLERDRYLSLLAASDLLIGNSSSGIIEAASLRTAVVNIGDRQALRDRGSSVFDCDVTAHAISDTIAKALAYDGTYESVYDAGGCAERLPDVLASLDISRSLIKKRYSF